MRAIGRIRVLEHELRRKIVTNWSVYELDLLLMKTNSYNKAFGGSIRYELKAYGVHGYMLQTPQ